MSSSLGPFDFSRALVLLKERKSVYRKSWKAPNTLWLSGEKDYIIVCYNEEGALMIGDEWGPLGKDLLAEDWMLYEDEEKKKPYR
jgi:hypothetical protein